MGWGKGKGKVGGILPIITHPPFLPILIPAAGHIEGVKDFDTRGCEAKKEVD